MVSGLEAAGHRVIAFTRAAPAATHGATIWRRLPSDGFYRDADPLPFWISLAPIWTLPEHFEFLAASGARRFVALSSTSRFTKDVSSDPAERALAARLAAGEDRLRDWAAAHGIEAAILRPTLIYGLGRDRNICAIARLIRSIGFFPLVGGGSGLRQPVHARDVAAACIAALTAPATAGRSYELSGGETITYREMVRRVFVALDRPARFAAVPLAAARAAVRMARLIPVCRHLTAGMIERMTQDLVFDHRAATRDIGFAPGPFCIAPEDLPPLDREDE